MPKYSEDEVCECCESPDVAHHDVEGIPLCDGCWKQLIQDSAMEETNVSR